MPNTTPITDVVSPADDQTPVKQADIFRAVEDGSRITGLIVTGDCDIAKGKNWGILTWVPLVPASSYVASGLLFDELVAQHANLRDDLATEITKQRSRKNLLPITKSTLVESLPTQTESGLVDILEDRPSADMVQKLNAVQMSLLAIDSAPPRSDAWSAEQIETIRTSLRAVFDARGLRWEKILDPAQNKFSSPPGDVFIIPNWPDDAGSVALLRFLREVSASDIGTTIGAARTSGQKLYRFARINSPYRYELAQRLGAVFSSIGLPDAYDKQRILLGKQTARTLTGNT